MKKKNILLLLIIVSCFLFLPNNVWAKEFKQINQTTKNEILEFSSNALNYSNSYKLDNGDYLVAGPSSLSRINNKGNIIWTHPVNDLFYDITVIGDYVYLSGIANPILKIKIADGVVVKEGDESVGYKLVNDGNNIYSIFNNYVLKFDKNANVVDEYECSTDIDDEQVSFNYSITIDDNYIYVINLVGTPYEYNYTDNDGNPHSTTRYNYVSRIIKLDMNLNKKEIMSINNYNLEEIGFMRRSKFGISTGAFFNDNSGNLYLVDSCILKMDKHGNVEILYNPIPGGDPSTLSTYKYYTAGTIVGKYLVVGGLKIINSGGTFFSSTFAGLPTTKAVGTVMRSMSPIVDVYDLNNNLIESHELKSKNEFDNAFDIDNITKTSNDGFLVKWVSSYYNDGKRKETRVLNQESALNIASLNVTEFGKVGKVKVNVKGLGKVKIVNGDCACGEEVELVTTPENGYYLRNLVVRDADGKKITVKDNKFVMPCNGDVIVDAQFREIVNPETSSIIIISILLGFMIVGSTIIARRKVSHE